MTLYKGSQKIGNVYKGGTNISKIYKGSQLIYSYLAFPIGTVLFDSATPGTYPITLPTGTYEVYCIAGGGGASARKYARYRNGSGGGSGSGFIGYIRITSKISARIAVGAGGSGAFTQGYDAVKGTDGGNSYIQDINRRDNIITTYGGKARESNYRGQYNDAAGGGAGGAAPQITVTVISQTLNRAGNVGQSRTNTEQAPGGASLYNGYGGGGIAGADQYYANAGAGGYVKIIYRGR